MANIRKFDEQQALEKLVEIFWRKGFEDTSLDDLVEATGIKRQSLYNSFGNKQEMFLKAYECYLSAIDSKIAVLADAEQVSPLKKVSNIMEAFLASIKDENIPNGCFVANTVMVCSEHLHDELKEKLQEHYESLEGLFYQLLLEAKQQGELSDNCKPRAIAQSILANIVALTMFYRLNQNEAFTDNVFNELVRSIKAA